MLSFSDRINGLLDELEAEIDAMTTSSRQSGQAIQAARVLEKSIEELKSQRVRPPEQMLKVLATYRAQALEQDTNRAVSDQIYERLAQLLRKLPRPATKKIEGVSKERCRQVILEVLLLSGGEATRQSVLEKAQELLQSELTDYDLEIQQKGSLVGMPSF